MRPVIVILMLLTAITLFAETVTAQGFEAGMDDTWDYTANPAGMNRMVWWGRSDQALGGANAQAGAWFWASWDLDNIEHSLCFASNSLTSDYSYNLSFYYYTNGLIGTDYSRYCMEFDSGTEWNNWITLEQDTDAWTQVNVSIPTYVRTIRLKVEAKYDGFGKYAHWDSFSLTKIPLPFYNAPIVYNANIAQRTDGSKIVDINYSLDDADNDLCTISLLYSTDGGATFNVFPNPENLNGDLGDNIVCGSGKHITWNAGAESIDYDTDTFSLRILAEDNSIPNNFVYVEGGTIFPTTGNYTDGLTVSSFYIDKYELTQAEYQNVMGSNPAHDYGVGDNYPVYFVSWFNAIEYCNRRSIEEYLTPCYSYLNYGTNPDDWPIGWNNSTGNHTNVACNWAANGYRLPLKAEWEYAARGGLQTHNYLYSGSNNLNGVGWYDGNSNGSTHTVGQLTANELGIYDMSGNEWEWCWDINGVSTRVIRGGSFNYIGTSCTVTSSGYGSALTSIKYIGFRVCRPIPWVATPQVSPVGGYYEIPQTVTITCNTVEAMIYYTTDGSEPSENSIPYTDPFIISADLLLKVKAFKNGVGPSVTVEIEYHGFKFGYIPEGTFTMGDTRGGGESDELPIHSVILNAFYMGKHEVTQIEYAAIMGSNPSSGYGVGDNYPVYYVNWYSAIKYCNLRSINEGLTPVYSINSSTNPTNWGEVPSSDNVTWNMAICDWNADGYRLPTEAEWEYAARGATNTPDYLYSGSDDINTVAWFVDNNSPYGCKPVGTKAPNALGLYDMSGNVFEWCWDWYDLSYYSNTSGSNPTGPDSGAVRVARGGRWNISPNLCRVADRNYRSQFSNSSSGLGFRLCRAFP